MKDEHIFDTFVEHARLTPDKIAISLLNPDNIYQIDQQISYQDLLNDVTRLAAKLRQHITEGDRVLLCYPTGINFIVAFYACLLAKGIAVSVIVPNHTVLLKKFLTIHQDCQPKIILTDSQTRAICHQALADDNALIFATDIDAYSMNPSIFSNIQLERPNIRAQDIAFLQYTSGSTAHPKGVVITHGNLIDNLKKIAEAFESKFSSIGVNWLPHTHDMGLIGSFFHSVYMGASLYLMSPFTMLRRPLAWLQALSHYRATISGGPCFMLKLCLEHLTLEKINDLDLRALQYLIVGSEPIHPDIVRDFFEKLAPSGLSAQAFTPAYGLAEATLMVSARSGLLQVPMTLTPEAKPTQVVSCGKPHQTIKIISTQTNQICAEGEIGEIWIAGQSIAKGYWQKPQETQEAFQAFETEPNQIYFKSGDLGFIKQNELFIVGRLKDMIIINGVNYYPEDIERSLLSCDERMHDAACVVFRWREEHAFMDQFVVLIRGNKQLFALQDQLCLKIKKLLLKEYQLIPHDIQFVRFNFPKTTSGKIQRYACVPLYIEHCIKATHREETC